MRDGLPRLIAGFDFGSFSGLISQLRLFMSKASWRRVLSVFTRYSGTYFCTPRYWQYSVCCRGTNLPFLCPRSVVFWYMLCAGGARGAAAQGRGESHVVRRTRKVGGRTLLWRFQCGFARFGWFVASVQFGNMLGKQWHWWHCLSVDVLHRATTDFGGSSCKVQHVVVTTAASRNECVPICTG